MAVAPAYPELAPHMAALRTVLQGQVAAFVPELVQGPGAVRVTGAPEAVAVVNVIDVPLPSV